MVKKSLLWIKIFIFEVYLSLFKKKREKKFQVLLFQKVSCLINNITKIKREKRLTELTYYY